MKKLFMLVLLTTAALWLWVISLRRSLQAAELRGDMYRDIVARLDRRVTELTAVDAPDDTSSATS